MDGDKAQQDVFLSKIVSISLLVFDSEDRDYDPAAINHPSLLKVRCFGG